MQDLLATLAQLNVRIEVRQGKLHINAPSGVMTQQLQSAILERKDELIAKLSATRRAEPEEQFATITADLDGLHHHFALNDVQHAYWIGRASQIQLGNISTHIYFEFDCEGIDAGRLGAALRKVIAHHDMLRAVVDPDGRQRILHAVPDYEIAVRDLRSEDQQRRNSELLLIRAELAQQVIPSDRWPLFEIRLARISDRHSRLFVSWDMLMLDAWSLLLVFRQWRRFYDDPACRIDRPTISFRDYLLAEMRLRELPVYRKAREYWWNRIDGLPAAPLLPVINQVETGRKYSFVRRRYRLSASRWDAIQAHARRSGITPSSTLLAAFAEVLTRWSKSAHYCLNLTLFNRLPMHEQVNDLVGDFTNLMLLEIDGEGDSFQERAARIQSQFLRDFEQRRVSAVEVIRELVKRRGWQGRAAYPVVFTSTLMLDGKRTDDSSVLESFGPMTYGISQTPQVWLDYQIFEAAGDLVFNWDAVEEMFLPGVLDGMFDAHQKLLEALATGAAWLQDEVVQLPEDQQSRRVAVNDTNAQFIDGCLQTPFVAMALQDPHRLAVSCGDRELTYGELLARSSLLADELVGLGVGPNQLVAVVMRKGWEQVVAVLGVLIAGAAYLPIDANWPAKRRELLLSQGEVKVLVTQEVLERQLEWPADIRRLSITSAAVTERLISAPTLRQSARDLAYVIFTSGSTGTPKGVMIDHSMAVNTVAHMNRLFGVTANDSVLAVSELSFDLSVYDIFGFLTVGGSIILPQVAASRDPQHWCELIRAKQISVWNSAPQLLGLLVDFAESDSTQDISSLRLVLLSGDWIPVRLPNRMRSRATQARVVSLGGATEGSVWSIYYPVEQVDVRLDSIPYGKPLPNQHMYVLNRRLQPCPDFVSGDIYIGGMGVARGYWRDEQKTAAQFVRHPLTDERLYRTGDLGRYRADDNIEFLGREDSQVKVRGFRVELGEIAATLQSHPDVCEAVVRLLKHDGRASLIAYIVAHRSQDSELFEWTSVPEPELQQSFQLVDQAGRKQMAQADRAGLAAFHRFWNAVQKVCNCSMFETLSSLGLLDGVPVAQRLAKLQHEGRIKPHYQRLAWRWLKTLAHEGVIGETADGYRSSGPHDITAMSVDQQLHALRASCERDARLLDYFDSVEAFLRNQLGLLSGQVAPLELLFPAGSWRLAEAWYEKNPAGQHHGGVMAAILDSLVRAWSSDKKIRILELGAGTGGMSAALLPRLPGHRTEYWYTDVSAYFFASAKQKFSRYPFVHFATYNIDKDPRSQGHEPNSYDIVVAANVFHNATDLPTTLQHVRALLKAGGLVMMLEGTQNTSWQWVNASYLESIESYSDARAQADAPVLDVSQWLDVLKSNELERVAVWPPPRDEADAALDAIAPLLNAMPQHVFVAQGPAAVAQFRPQTLTRFLEERIPQYMIPQRYLPLEKLPLSANGKVDLDALPRPDAPGQSAARNLIVPRSAVESRIVQIWKDVLGLQQLSITDSFFEVGGDSLLLTEVMRRLNASEHSSLVMADMFSHPTVQALAARLSGQASETSSASAAAAAVVGGVTTDVAIIGLAGRFPDAANVQTLWENLAAAKCAVRHFSDAELLEAGVSHEELAQKNYVKAGVVLENKELFDAAFFGMTPREAEITDPQHRFLLECALEALENAGYANERYGGRIGVFAGKSSIFYLVEHVLQHPQIVQDMGLLQVMNVNDKDHVATLVSYKLNLTGPSLNINTACSTSLVAVHAACQSLLNAECEIALAGGVSFVSMLKLSGYLYQEGHITSPDGYCRAFADDANGCVFGSGVGLVVLKPLANALRDRDTIHAVIKGTAINNDGSLKVGYSAPSLQGQADVIAAALAKAGVAPDTIQYLEAHGTATNLGDPIEFGALRKVFGGPRLDGSRCALGSVKTNVGHLDSAAGITGLIKVAEALKHRQIPASLHAVVPSRKIGFQDSPFYINSQLTEWRAGAAPRRAGVSSFGVGGTNAHAVLEEAPALMSERKDASSELLILSAQDASRLEAMRQQLAAHLERHPDLSLRDVAFTLQVGRNGYKHRTYLVCDDLAAAARQLKSNSALPVREQHQGRSSCVTFVLPELNVLRPGSIRELYQEHPPFAAALDTCAALIREYTGQDIRIAFMDEQPATQSRDAADTIAATQPLLFAIEYALVKFWQSLGVRPVAMLGRGLGEYVAACIAEVCSLEEALSLVIVRAQLLESLPRGCMLSVNCSEAELRPLLQQSACGLAAVEGPSQCVVSGAQDALAQLRSRLDACEISSRFLAGSHVLQSSMLEPVLDAFTECVAQIKLNPPRIPFISSISGDWITEVQATSPSYWAQHLRAAVQLFVGMQRLQSVEGAVVLEVVPDADRRGLLNSMGRLWLHGIDVDWTRIHQRDGARRIPLPTYPFARNRYWIERRPIVSAANPVRSEDQAAAAAPASRTAMHAKLIFGELAAADHTVHRRPELSTPYVPPTNAIEARLVEMWQSYLGIEGVGIDDNFFALGGDSLLATRVYASVAKEFGAELPVKKMFDFATIRNIYLFIATSKDSSALEALSEEEMERLLALMDP